MKKMQKWLAFALALVLLLASGSHAWATSNEIILNGTFEDGVLVDDKPENVTVNIHKLHAESYNITEAINHNGGKLTNDQLKELVKPGVEIGELDGVTFTYYSVTEEQLEAFKAKPGDYDTKEKVEAYLKKAGVTAPAGTDIVTAGGNGATATLGEGFYWVVESGHPDTVTSSLGVPFGFSLPLTNEEGTKYLNTVHFYPKNVQAPKTEEDKTVKDLKNKNASYKIGDTVPWYLHATIPANIGDYVKLQMTDALDSRLTYVGEIVVKYGNEETFDAKKLTLVKDVDYTIEQEPAAGAKGGTIIIKITEAGFKNLAAHYVSEGEVVAEFKTYIGEDAIMGQDIKNGYDLDFQNSKNNQEEHKTIPEEKKPKVNTSGKLFKKVDGAGAGLEDAIFELRNGDVAMKWTQALLDANAQAIQDGKFAVLEDGTYIPTSNGKKPAVDTTIYLRSVDGGVFEIKGLEYSQWNEQVWDKDAKQLVNSTEHTNSYSIKEVKAPEGYALLGNAISFTVDANSYYQDPTAIDSTATAGNAESLDITNKKITIPPTGGMGTVIFSIVGVAVMIFAVMAYRKNQQAEA